MKKDAIVELALKHIRGGDVAAAASAINSEWPFEATAVASRTYSKRDLVKVFRRDGYIDRYDGQRLIFPGALRVLSIAMPEVFPFHKNWKMNSTHPAYWFLCPTIDHVTPISRGGSDFVDNWVTTSMTNNSAKANWTLEELGWSLVDRGDIADWDGLEGLFKTIVDEKPSLLDNGYLRLWYAATR